MKLQHLFLMLSCCVWHVALHAQGSKVFMTLNGGIKFRSDAPQELIKAESKEMKGAIESNGKTFTFKVMVNSFKGFNSGLQQTHFNENYMESAQFPEATFKGKIIEDLDLSKDGRYEVRAKGILTIHGVEQERIIKSDLIIRQGKMFIHANFTVSLPDHGIPIPRIVKDKLSQEIKVEIMATLEPR